MSCFCVRGFGGRLGFLSFWGLFWLVRRVFSGSGFFWFLASSCLLAVWSWGGGGAGCWGFSRVRGWVRPVLLLLLVGVGWVRLARPDLLLLLVGGVLGACARMVLAFLLVWGVGVGCVCVWFILGMRFPGVGRTARLLFRGLGVPGFLFRVRGGFWSCSRRGFRVFLFPLGASFLWFGGCRVGLGLFFLRLFCPVRVRVGSLLGVGPGSGLGLVLFGEFDPGSGRTLAACLTHASRTGPSLFLGAG